MWCSYYIDWLKKSSCEAVTYKQSKYTLYLYMNIIQTYIHTHTYIHTNIHNQRLCDKVQEDCNIYEMFVKHIRGYPDSGAKKNCCYVKWAIQSQGMIRYCIKTKFLTCYYLTLSPSVAPYGAFTNKYSTTHNPILNLVSKYAEWKALTTL